MSYTSLGYMLFVACCLIFYYIFPKKHRCGCFLQQA